MHPVLLQTPWVTLYTYGLLVASGALLAFVLALWMAPSAGITKAEAADLVLLLFVSGIVGAHSFYVGQHPEQYVGRFWHAWSLQEGGLVWYGGFILAVIAGVLYAAVKRLSVMKLCDLFSPVAALAHALGRLGCFFNGCCYGREASLPWGVSFGPGAPLRLPTQLYEAVFLWVLGIHLLLIYKKAHRTGEVFMRYLCLYGLFRFLIEFVRGDQELYFFLTIPQWTSLFLVAGALILGARIVRGGRS